MSQQPPTCPACGLHYVVGSPKDEAHHRRFHKDYEYGPKVNAVAKVPSIEKFRDLTIHIVDGNIPLAVRRKFYEVALVACREIDGPAGYDGTYNDQEQRLLVAAVGSRVVAMVLTATDDRFWPLRWKPDGTIEMREKRASLHRSQKVARVWVAASRRRSGLGPDLVRVASRRLECPIPDLGWEMPFTDAGARLIKRLLPTEFWGCGDPFTLQETLERSVQS